MQDMTKFATSADLVSGSKDYFMQVKIFLV
jgi:hypothetical protein